MGEVAETAPLLDEESEDKLSSRCCQRKPSRHSFGLFLAALSAVVTVVCDTLVKLILNRIGPIENILLRYILLMIIFLIIFKYKGDFVEAGWKSHLAVIIASAFRAFGPYLRYFALKYITLLDSTSILFSNLIYASLMSCIFLRKCVGNAYDFSCLAISIVGTLLVWHPSFIFGGADSAYSTTRLLGLGMASAAAALAAFHTCVVRYSSGVPVSYLMLQQGFFGTLFGGISFAVPIEPFAVPSDYKTWLIVGTILVLVLFYLTIETHSMQMIEPHEYTLLKVIEIPTSFVFQVLVFKKFPTYLEASGALLILVSVIGTALKDFIFKRFSGQEDEQQ